MTDAEYAGKLRQLAGGRTIREVIVDPSAASFIEVLRREGWKVRKADNDVLSGIRRTADALRAGRIVICDRCTDCLREMELYVWDLAAGGGPGGQEERSCDGRYAVFCDRRSGKRHGVCCVGAGTENLKR